MFPDALDTFAMPRERVTRPAPAARSAKIIPLGRKSIPYSVFSIQKTGH